MTDRPGGNPEENQSPAHITMDRLDEKIEWYRGRSTRNMGLYFSLKSPQIVAAAAIPVLTQVGGSPAVLVAVLGAAVVVLEGFQQLGRFHENWLQHGLARKTLDREKYLYLADAEDNATAKSAGRLLARRLEDLLETSIERWVAGEEQRGDAKPAS